MTEPLNPSAFPYAVPQEFNAAETGMSLRDWFAGRAMAAFIIGCEHFDEVQDDSSCAAMAYRIADAMLLARQGDA